MGTREVRDSLYVSRPFQTRRFVLASLIVTFILGGFVGTLRVVAVSSGIQRGIEADAARYQAMGEYYVQMTMAIQRGNDASSARWDALGNSYAEGFPEPSYPDVTTKRYTDVSKFYGERMRAQTQSQSELAANPELIIARHFTDWGVFVCSAVGC